MLAKVHKNNIAVIKGRIVCGFYKSDFFIKRVFLIGHLLFRERETHLIRTRCMKRESAHDK